MNFRTKTKIIIAVLAFVMCTLNTVSAQQTPLFSEYNYNPFIINPAYAGVTPNTEFSISNMGYFNAFEGSPKSFAFSGHGSINEKKAGIGAGITRDQIGVTTSTRFFASYAYKIYFDFDSNRPYWQNYHPGVLSFGATIGLQQYQDNLTELGIMDDHVFAEDINATVPSIGFGFLFNHHTFYIGISSPNVLGDALVSDKSFNITNTYYGYLGYRIYNNRFKDLMIKPNILLKHENGAPLQADINVAVSFKNQFELGAGYRTSNSYNLLAGIYLFNNFRFMYSYNLATNNSPLGNAHSFILSCQLGKGYQVD
ncbi:type IX secretion system membrane protein PorP/SprF [Winogradskyella eckloniae]|uniref:PorP/SprF family type IX secretion system membrane protein n=1 Tax=Winogradskyella eckloniae TaxID=1089306 RepID=UPI0015656836|nr:PorP/SprF family type IX secretion system membrane protein [Winogradskyella eckloniae]NRD21351.1 type IX secretion system membrane protein PorP/SprF [Winogradskyella eckloniae]